MKVIKVKHTRTKFWKYQSEGNDFVIVHDSKSKALQKPKSLQKICNRVTGIGANGAIFMNKTSKGWAWSFYNEDGSTADMCGNGAKCAALWLKKHGEPQKKSWHWNSSLGQVNGEPGKGDIMWVKWPIASKPPNTAVVQELGELLDGLNERGLAYLAFINTGIPHLVMVNHESWTPTDRSSLNEQLRHHLIFGTPGTNVSWHSLGTGESVTFERGVEAETNACGTGALAIFRALEDMGRAKSQATLKFPGGKLFAKKDKNGEYWLGGTPTEVFSGEISL
jgi:diaminopimelate epimerase